MVMGTPWTGPQGDCGWEFREVRRCRPARPPPPHRPSQAFPASIQRTGNGWTDVADGTAVDLWCWQGRQARCKRLESDPLQHCTCAPHTELTSGDGGVAPRPQKPGPAGVGSEMAIALSVLIYGKHPMRCSRVLGEPALSRGSPWFSQEHTDTDRARVIAQRTRPLHPWSWAYSSNLPHSHRRRLG